MGPCSGPCFICQFEAMTGHGNWTDQKKATRLLAILWVQTVCVLHSIPTEATYEDIIQARLHITFPSRKIGPN